MTDRENYMGQMLNEEGQARAAILDALERLRGDLEVSHRCFACGNEVQDVAEMLKHVQEVQETFDEVGRRLCEERDVLQQCLDVAGVMFVVLDREGRVTRVNRLACRILGYGEDEIMGADWFVLFIPDGEREAVRAVFGQLMRGEIAPVEFYENAVVARNGETRRVAWRNALMRDETGAILGTLSSGEDVTERRLAEEEHRKLEEQLHQAQKMEAVGQLAGGVAHDFNNLLQVITGNTEMAIEEVRENAEAMDCLDEVRKASERATSLVRQLLTFSRREMLKLEYLDLNEIVAGLSKMLRRVIGEHIELLLRLGDNLPPVLADAGQIEQILMNLCVNGRDAMPEGGRLVIETRSEHLDADYCRVFVEAQEGPYAMLSVSDTGMGIPQEIQDRVFEPFFTTKGVGEGTGLGLATVYAITKRHEGFLKLYSEAGQGTTFRVYLPAAAGGVANAEAPGGEETSVLQGTGTILLAEDDEQVRELGLRILRKAGYEVIAACDGEEAIGLLDDCLDRVDLALLDVVMPKANGKAVYEALRARDPNLPVLFASGYSYDVLEGQNLPGTAADLIHKPFGRRELLKRVRLALDKGR